MSFQWKAATAEKKTTLRDVNVTTENSVNELVGKKLLIYNSHKSHRISRERRAFATF